MIKSKLLISLILISIIGGCGFHTPHKNKSINAEIIGDTNSIIARKLNNNFDRNLESNLTIEISKEIKKKTAITFNNDGSDLGYQISYIVPIKFYGKDGSLLLDKKFSKSTYQQELSSSQANIILLGDTYDDLAESLVIKILRNLNYLSDS